MLYGTIVESQSIPKNDWNPCECPLWTKKTSDKIRGKRVASRFRRVEDSHYIFYK